jgi:hypothetical protein
MYAKYLSNIVFQHLLALIDDIIYKKIWKVQLFVVFVDYWTSRRFFINYTSATYFDIVRSST